MDARLVTGLEEPELEAAILLQILATEPEPLSETGGGTGAYLMLYAGRNRLYEAISPSLRPIYCGCRPPA